MAVTYEELVALCSEIDAELGSENKRVLELASAAGPNDVLQVGLDEQSTPAQVEAIGQFCYCLVILSARCGAKQLSTLLGSLQRVAEVPMRCRIQRNPSGASLTAHAPKRRPCRTRAVVGCGNPARP